MGTRLSVKLLSWEEIQLASRTAPVDQLINQSINQLINNHSAKVTHITGSFNVSSPFRLQFFPVYDGKELLFSADLPNIGVHGDDLFACNSNVNPRNQ